MDWSKKGRINNSISGSEATDRYINNLDGEMKEVPIDSEQFNKNMAKVFYDCDDFHIRTFMLPSSQIVNIYFFKGVTDENVIEQSILKPLIERTDISRLDTVNKIGEVIHSKDYRTVANWPGLIRSCLGGNAILHISGTHPIQIAVANPVKRSYSPPTTEPQIYGSKLAFIENSRSNIALLRKNISDPRLKVKDYFIGSLSQTHVGLVYVDDYVDKGILNEVSSKLKDIDVDQLLNSHVLVEQLVESPNSIFPQIKKTERIDHATVALGEGKVVIVIDNAAFCIILPIGLFNFYEASDDNDEASTWNIFFIRSLRLASLVLSIVFPSIYVSLVAFHPELIPTTLAMTLVESRNNIPLPAAVEALLMMFALDVLVEASIRLPNFIGQTIGIVGGLVIGQAAVEAGIVSSAMVIVIAFTAIASFTVPSWELAASWRLVRYGLLIISSFLGLYGLTLGLAIVLIHLCSLESFSKPYLTPLSPLNHKNFLDIFFRFTTKKEQQVGGGSQNETKS